MKSRRYPEYKDSGVKWLGEVPSHWRVVPLKYVVSFRSGGTPSKDVEAYWNGDIPWASAKDMKLERLADTEDHLTDQAFADGAATLVESGAVLVVVRGMILARLFPVCLTVQPMAINQDLKAILPGPSLASEFLAWALRGTSDESLRRLDEAGHGTKALRMEAWSSLALALPPLPEQSAICAFLDRGTGKIDALIAEQEKLIELLREKRQAAISRAVTKGLDPTVPTKDSNIEWLGEVPAHWEVVRLGSLFRESTEPGGSDLPVLSVSIHSGVSDRELTDEEMDRKVTRSDDLSKYKRVQPDDLVYNMMRAWQGGFGSVSVNGQVSPAYVVARPTRPLRTPFVEQILRTPSAIEEMRRRSDGVTDFRLRLYWDEFKTIQIALPDLAEQAATIALIDRMTVELDTLITEARRVIELLSERRSALISAAVTGKIDVRHHSADIVRFTPRERRNILAAKVISQCYLDQTFGRTKAQKTHYLLENYLGLEEMGGQYERNAAGPYDRAQMESIATDLQAAAWFREVPQEDRYVYRPLAKAGEIDGLFEQAWADRRLEIDALIRLLRPLDTREAEVVTTLFAAWNDFILEGQAVDDETLITEVRTNWHPGKLAIPVEKWRWGLQWMRKNSVVPAGTGRRTVYQAKLI